MLCVGSLEWYLTIALVVVCVKATSRKLACLTSINIDTVVYGECQINTPDFSSFPFGYSTRSSTITLQAPEALTSVLIDYASSVSNLVVELCLTIITTIILILP